MQGFSIGLLLSTTIQIAGRMELSGGRHRVHEHPGFDRWNPCDLCLTGLDVKGWKSLSLDALAIGCGFVKKWMEYLAATCDQTALPLQQLLTGGL